MFTQFKRHAIFVCLILATWSLARSATIDAVYDSTLKAPKCAAVASGCHENTANGRGLLPGGNEPNQPNTINRSCTDGSSGNYHSDESLDELSITSLDGSNFAPGKSVRVDARVFAYSGYTSDHLDIYYTTNASSPIWTLIQTSTPTAASTQTLSATFTLGNSPLQAIRANFRYLGSAAPCVGGSYNDSDDLIFAASTGVASPPVITFTSPLPLSHVSGSINVTGNITTSSSLTRFEVREDLNPFQAYFPYSNFLYPVNTFNLTEGQHSVSIRATDAQGLISVATIIYTVDNASLPLVISTPTIYGIIFSTTNVLTESFSWTSSKPSTHSVDYGTTTALGSKVVGSTTPSQSHIQALSPLVELTTYYYRIATLSYGTTCYSSTYSFRTPRVPDSISPQVTIISPQPNQTVNPVNGFVTISGTAYDYRGVSLVQVSIDGNPFTNALGTSSWHYNWNVSSLTSNAHTISVVATDFSGLKSTATVACLTNLPNVPKIQITNPLAGQTVQGVLTISGTAFDLTAIQKVEVQTEAHPYVFASGTATWTFPGWDTRVIPNGAHVINARVTNTLGITSTTSITVNSLATPTINVVTVQNASPTSAIITWTTPEASDTNILYASQPLQIAILTGEVHIPQLQTNHSVTLSNLSANTSYYYLVYSRNSSGNERYSAPLVFRLIDPSQAIYDTTLSAPKCGTVGAACQTGTLVYGRASIVGNGGVPEPNKPNTIKNSCQDDIYGTYHSEESLDAISVKTLDGTPFAPGKMVKVDFTVWAYSSYWSDKLDVYYSANASTSTWFLVETITPTKAGAQVLSSTFALGVGGVQAIRGNFRYSGTPSICSSSGYDDRDDLVFAVGGQGTQSTTSAQVAQLTNVAFMPAPLSNPQSVGLPSTPHSFPTAVVSGKSSYHPSVSHGRYFPTTDGPLRLEGFPPRSQVSLINISGVQIQTIDIGSDGTADWTAGDVPSGIYLAVCETSHESYRVKFVVIH